MIYSYRIEQAIRAAAVLHEGQVRKGKVPFPYLTHLVSVMLIVSDYTNEEDVIIAALLHDTLEDTDYTERELRADFGNTVTEYVLHVSEQDGSEAVVADWKERKEQYAKLLDKAPEGSLIVSAADKIHNMRSIIEEYYTEHERFMEEFGGSLEDRVRMYQEISNVLNRRLQNDIIHEFNHVFDEYKKFITYVQKEAQHS
ncbi:bifunctional (p)ppGpp synthetase/guanosine-3',5'-bis(diphosphate) 3'-pyrophosphohydrolase [Candidatus Parcubacteria bacterium]|uniref:Bifunctional (P)ppGpp synthetase/guanosine-3',5'-bis(Diphosphate) 3'-pyrophosphohydrolase n=1 Tax=Candidatus Kaiserbacteria bacterium CG10_big_fil_rev_8_21_14_0_10_47_16 TaxID=1974608 RepID=A0A2H0UDD4_9BACT|nr:bifunctional (p)ppGpp synthetase/guanosine-3',5'-bis(diphosphate) 3'-pyrophosphohydrolase [Candidatus Parcubacteria bacterium]PIR84433.1 MAG: bifunctional (p)ppGpp synthetase/guanosine-3',5'-bis(diphosphate) 3'-pyrophosphohydrolase [Candidatus Kaiserbacteria bacterium CG10_big_fil_rev_8_21_14_0_10_47_16]